MIERKFVADNVKEFQIKEFVKKTLGKAGISEVKLQKTPLGEKIVVSSSRPGLVVGRGGSNIARLTKELKANFKLDNPQIEIEEVVDIGLDANIIAEMIAGSLERFGSARFKGIGHRALTNVISSGALGVEILISGRIPSSRAKTWRFYMGYLKKCGDLSISGVEKAYAVAKLKTGIVGIKVSIMPGTVQLPDKIQLISEIQENIEEVKGKEGEEAKEEIEKETAEKAEKPKSEDKKQSAEKKETKEKKEEPENIEKKAENKQEEKKKAETEKKKKEAEKEEDKSEEEPKKADKENKK